MKRNVLQHILLLFILISGASHTTSLFAQRQVKSGSLFICSPEKALTSVELDGPQHVEETYMNNLLFSPLIPGEYYLRISMGEGRRSRVIVDQVIRINPETRITLNIQRDGRFVIQSSPDRSSIFLTFEILTPNSQPYNASETISSRDFERLKAEIKRKAFDKDKIELLDISSGYNLFYTNQIAEIMKLFAFDEGKLSCAEILAPRAYDPKNLIYLADIFSFQGTKDKYMNFLKQQKPSRRH